MHEIGTVNNVSWVSGTSYMKEKKCAQEVALDVNAKCACNVMDIAPASAVGSTTTT